MDRAIDIKRRAQRCIQGGDLPGALAEYEKLIAADATDPYTYVLLADLLYKMGEHPKAGERYLTAAACYEQTGLYKNAIAVCKKMMRLALSPETVLERLASLHALDGLPNEAGLFLGQLAEHLARSSRLTEAAAAWRKAFEANHDDVRALERQAEVLSLIPDDEASAQALAEAALYHARAGHTADAEACRERAERLRPGVVAKFEAQAPPPPAPGRARLGGGARALPPAAATPEPGMVSSFDAANRAASAAGDSGAALETDRPPRFVPPTGERLDDMEIERHGSSQSHAAADAQRPPTLESQGERPPDVADLQSIEHLLGLAQTEFQAGRHADAAQILARAALEYEALGCLEEAASIHRSLSRSPHATGEMLDRWFANCERRGQHGEAAEVACDLGDRAFQVGDVEVARAWFERALALDPANPVASRRLSRLASVPAATDSGAPAEPTAPAAPAAAAPVARTGGKVEVAVDRGQAVTFDFASMLAEFQRGVGAQLAGDAQANYDLAVAYREMGLVEEAIESFRLAGMDADFSQRCAEMIGRCMLDEGRFEEAVYELTHALALAALDPEIGASVRFHLGLAYEYAGRLSEALVEFERVIEAYPGHPDASERIQEMKRQLEAA